MGESLSAMQLHKGYVQLHQVDPVVIARFSVTRVNQYIYIYMYVYIYVYLLSIFAKYIAIGQSYAIRFLQHALPSSSHNDVIAAGTSDMTDGRTTTTWIHL